MAAFYNQASLTYNGTVTSSNITAGEILEVLSASKNAVTDTYTVGNDVVFIININNSGTTDITGLTLTDDLGAYSPVAGAAEVVPLTYTENSVNLYINGVKQADPTIVSESPLTISGIDIPAGGNVSVIYAAKPNQYAPLGEDSSITNTATIGSARISSITVSETITPDTSAALSISKSLSPAVVSENGTVTYTFIIQNSGSTAITAADDVIFSDTFTPVLNQLSASFNGTAWSAGTNYTYDESTGTFVSLAGQITVPAATITQDELTGTWTVQPGISTLIITGTI